MDFHIRFFSLCTIGKALMHREKHTAWVMCAELIWLLISTLSIFWNNSREFHLLIIKAEICRHIWPQEQPQHFQIFNTLCWGSDFREGCRIPFCWNLPQSPWTKLFASQFAIFGSVVDLNTIRQLLKKLESLSKLTWPSLVGHQL